MLIGRHDIEKLMQLDPASACLPSSFGQQNWENSATDAESMEVELELTDLLLNLRPIKQVCAITDGWEQKYFLSNIVDENLKFIYFQLAKFLLKKLL